MENKIYYRIEIYKGLFNHDVGFDGMGEPVTLKVDVENDDVMRAIVSAAVFSCNTCVVYVEDD